MRSDVFLLVILKKLLFETGVYWMYRLHTNFLYDLWIDMCMTLFVIYSSWYYFTEKAKIAIVVAGVQEIV